jgi:hypothetical protein
VRIAQRGERFFEASLRAQRTANQAQTSGAIS